MGFHEAAFTTSVVSVDDDEEEEVAAVSVVEDAAIVSDDSELLEHALRRTIDKAAAMLRLVLIFMDRFLARWATPIITYLGK